MEAVLKPNRPDTENLPGRLRTGRIRVECAATSRLYRLAVPALDLLSTGPQDEWDRKMKENYEDGGALKKLVQKGREDYRTGNTSRLP